MVRVDKELYEDVFRRPPKLTPLEARAIRLALEFVRADERPTRTPLDKVGGKLEETFGQFELAQTPEVPVETDEERLVTTLSGAMEHHRVVRIEYMKEDEAEPTTRRSRRTSSCASSRTGTCTRGTATPRPRTFQLDRMHSAEPTGDFEARPDFDPSYLRDPRMARILYAKPVARWKVERGARLLADGSAVADVPYATEWLLTEILADRGEAVVLEPERFRPSPRAPAHSGAASRPPARPRGARPAARRSGRGPLPRPDPRPAAAGTRGPFPRGGRGERSGSRRRAPPRRQAGTPDPRCRAAPGWGRSRR